MTTGIGTVSIQNGQVSGIPLEGTYEGLTEFRGIPYAAPPLGERRWKAPENPASWDGVRTCETYGKAAIQKFSGMEPNIQDFYYRGHPEMSEDCLYLNVMTSAVAAGEKRPVYVWFHGGGLFNGYSYLYVFDASELVRKGAVVVSVGHRLNLFGYMALPQLTQEQGGVSGNYGLMDTIKALEWVRANIDSFGGDPDSITVGGQSGGTAKSSALATSPKTQGMVRRVINQSDLYWLRKHPSVQDVEESSRDYLSSVGIDPDLSLDELRNLDVGAFLGADGNINRFPSSMVADGIYVKHADQQQNYLEFGTGLDYLAGSNFGEINLRGKMFQPDPFVDPEDFYDYMKTFLGDLYDTYDFPSLYPVTQENLNRRTRRMASYGMNGRGGIMVSRMFGAYRKQRGDAGRMFTYLFSHVTPTRPEDEGTERDAEKLLAWHSSELWYTFNSLKPGVPPARPWQPLDFELADRMSDYWVNFIRTGDPNGPGLPEWPQSDGNYGWMELGDELEGHSGLGEKLDEMVHAYLVRSGTVPTE